MILSRKVALNLNILFDVAEKIIQLKVSSIHEIKQFQYFLLKWILTENERLF